MEKKLNVKKEVFESLRLELQEFVPQEFVATCWKITVNCNSYGWFYYGDDEVHHDGGHAATFYVSSNSKPTSLATAISLLSTGQSSYSASKQQHLTNNQQRHSGFSWEYNGSKHFATTNSPISSEQNSNISG